MKRMTNEQADIVEAVLRNIDAGMDERVFAADIIASLPELPAEETDVHGVKCEDCGKPYGGDDWLDVIVPDQIWKKIMPGRGEGGILCANCTAARMAKYHATMAWMVPDSFWSDEEAPAPAEPETCECAEPEPREAYRWNMSVAYHECRKCGKRIKPVRERSFRSTPKG